MERKATVIASTLRIDGGPYGSRLASLFQSAGVDYEFWGWDRDGAMPPPSAGQRLLLSGGGFHNWKLAACYLAWIWVTFLATLRFARRGSIVFSLGTFSAVGPAIAGFFKPLKLVYINNDNVSLSYRFPKVVSSLIAAMESLLARRAVVHVIPSAQRWSRWSGNLIVVKNTPTRSLLDTARGIATDRGYRPAGDCFTLYVNGWLTETRGTAMILDVVRRLRDCRFRLLLAGKPQCRAARELMEEPGVEYAGLIDRKEALALYYRADMVATFYDPSIAINRLAESNKWYECALTRTPFVVNEEVLTAMPFRDAGACFTVRYDDGAALETLIRELTNDSHRLEGVRRNLESIQCRCLEEEFQSVFAALAI